MKKVLNRMQLVFESRSVNEAFARTAVAAFVAPLDPTLEELIDLKTAVSEAVTNAIVHAYAARIDRVTVTAKLLEGEEVVVQVRDRGCGIADVAQAMEPLYTTGTGERAGLGFTLMQTLTDRVQVRSAPGRGTTVTLHKTIRRRGA